MDDAKVRLEDFLAEVGFGEVRFHVIDRNLLIVPKQRIEKPRRIPGLRIEIIIDEPIYLKKSDHS